MADVSERIVDSGTAVRSAMNKRDEDRAHMGKGRPKGALATFEAGPDRCHRTDEYRLDASLWKGDDRDQDEIHPEAGGRPSGPGKRYSKEKITKLKKESEEASALEARIKIDLAALRKIEDSMGQELNELRLRKESLFRQKDRPRERPRKDRIKNRDQHRGYHISENEDSRLPR